MCVHITVATLLPYLGITGSCAVPVATSSGVLCNRNASALSSSSAETLNRPVPYFDQHCMSTEVLLLLIVV